MPHFPSLPDDALVGNVYPMNPKLFKPWCEVEEAIMRFPSDRSMFKERGVAPHRKRSCAKEIATDDH